MCWIRKMKKDETTEWNSKNRKWELSGHIRNALILLLEHIHTKWNWRVAKNSTFPLPTMACELLAPRSPLPSISHGTSHLEWMWRDIKKGGEDREQEILNGHRRENIFYCYIFFPINWMSPAIRCYWLALCSILYGFSPLILIVIFTLRSCNPIVLVIAGNKRKELRWKRANSDNAMFCDGWGMRDHQIFVGDERNIYVLHFIIK